MKGNVSEVELMSKGSLGPRAKGGPTRTAVGYQTLQACAET